MPSTVTISGQDGSAVEKRQRAFQLERDAGVAERVEDVGAAGGGERRRPPVAGRGQPTADSSSAAADSR